MTTRLAEPDLLALDAAMERAFATGDASGLDVLGYGEITTVVAWESGGARYACKRLPTFPTQEDADAYRAVFEKYVSELNARGANVAPSVLQTVDREAGAVAVYCVQPALPQEALAVRRMAAGGEETTAGLFRRILDVVCGCVSERLGLDGQLSNWMFVGDDLVYLDVTTPLLKDETGNDLLDTDLFLASAPGPTRALLRRFVLRGVIDKYHDARGVVVDLLGNLYKEDQARLVPRLCAEAGRRISPPVSVEEVRRYYAADARVWMLWQALRRADRFWHLLVRRRPYPFLLPGRIERRV